MTLFTEILNGIMGFGVFAPWIFSLVYILGASCFFPTALLALAAGALFGLPGGFALALACSLFSASVAFLAGKHLSRRSILKYVETSEKVRAVDEAVERRGWKLILLLRLSAILPYVVLNYGLGLSKIRFKHYFFASLIGMIPGTLLYVYLGSLAGRMAFEREAVQKIPLEWALASLGLAATIVMGFYAASVVQKALKTCR